MRHRRKSAEALEQLTPVIAQFISRSEITEPASVQTKWRDNGLLTTHPRGEPLTGPAIKFTTLKTMPPLFPTLEPRSIHCYWCFAIITTFRHRSRRAPDAIPPRRRCDFGLSQRSSNRPLSGFEATAVSECGGHMQGGTTPPDPRSILMQQQKRLISVGECLRHRAPRCSR